MVRRLNQYLFALRISTYVLPLFAFIGAWAIRFGSSKVLNGEYEPYGYFSLLVFTTIVWAVVTDHWRLTGLEELFRERTGARGILKAVTGTYFVVLAVLYLSHSEVFSRVFLVVSGVVLLFLTFWLRSTFRVLVRRKSGSRKPIRVLMVGADQFARQGATRLETGPFACRIVGYVRLPDQDVAISGMPVYELNRVSQMHFDHGIDELVVAVNPAEFSRIPAIMSSVEQLGLPVRAIIDLGEATVIRERLFQFGRLQMLDLISTPADNLNYSLVKRAFDVAFSSVTLIICAPLMLVIALVVKLTSPGPVLFSQDRVGLNGKIFKMYKFRTMKVAPSKESDTVWTTMDDSRRTAIGSFLRRTSLDELPQFFNVLLGDMSVVGPRPERPHFVKKFLADVSRYNDRHRLKVGITGWAQVNGYRGDTPIQKRVEYDLYYLQNWSISFDMRIILATVMSAIIGKNAY